MYKEKDKKTLFYWEVGGFFFVCLMVLLFRFMFSFTGGNFLFALFFALNESVWEQLKLVFWPALFWGLTESIFIKKKTNNFFAAKVFAATFMVVFIISGFYLYTSISGHIKAMDIFIFVISVALGQMLGYRIFRCRKFSDTVYKISIAIIAVWAFLFLWFSFNPLKIDIFRDYQMTSKRIIHGVLLGRTRHTAFKSSFPWEAEICDLNSSEAAFSEKFICA